MNATSTDTRRHRVLVATVLFAATVLLFWRATRHDFVNYDDPDYVTENVHVRRGLDAAGVRWALTADVASNWHPLTWMSHMLDWSLFGDNPHGHHVTSVLLHGLGAALAFLALRRLTGSFWTSAFCAALFAWHPLRVESVAWVAERKDVLAGVFWFLTLWAYAGYAERRRTAASGAFRFYGLALAAFGLGLTAKPMLVTLPCVLLLLDYWPLQRVAKCATTLGCLLLEKLPFFALSAGSSVITFFVQKRGGSVSDALDFSARLENAVVAVVRYLGKFAWPFDLAVLYPHPGVWPNGKVVACVVILAAITIAALVQSRRRPWLIVGWLWFLGTLVPVSGIVQVGLQSMADRYTYVPMLGVQLALLWTLREHASSPGAQRGLTLAAAIVLAALAARTWNQLGVWQNSFTLFDHAIAVTERNYLAHDNRGLFLYRAGRVDEAIADYRRALAINPAYPNANNNLGHALSELGRPAEAIPFLRTAVQAQPAQLEIRNNLANALSDAGQLDEAMEHYAFVLQRQPDHVNALNGSAVVLAMRGRTPEAKARLERALELAPDNASAHNNLGNVCSMLGERDAAVRHYLRAAELNPKDAHSLLLAGSILCQQEKFAAAAAALQRSVAIRPGNPEAHAYLGFALARLGRRDEALAALRTAVQQRPDDAQAQQWLRAVEQMR